ncbi:MAG: protein kinase, partial [Chloroflexota bacterium]
GNRLMIDLINGQLDRYELKERIGTGGMARVYKAWDTSLERLVAIKILHEHLADDPTFKERFEREAKFIAGFNHPNIVQVYDFNVIYRDGLPICYMVMSYIPGQTLRDVLEEANMQGKRLPLTRVQELVDDLSKALGYAHMRGMVHRDVKPGNILLNEHGKAILTDFGIARMVQSNRLTADGVSTGTPIYMSPEQANGQGGDIRSDLYSLGIIVYELLASRPPFVDDTSLAVMLKHLNTTPPLVSEFIKTRQFDAFLAKALAKKPEDRFQTSEEFALAFRATFDVPDFEKTTMVPGIPSIPTPRTTTLATSVFQTISQRAKENPRISAAIVIASLGAVALVILLLFNSNAVRNAQAPEATLVATTVASVPSMTDVQYFDSTFDAGDANNLYWPTLSTTFLTSSFVDGRYQLRNTQPQTAETGIFQTTTSYTNFAIKMVARLEPNSKDASGYGIVFRYQDEDNYNVFAVDGEGRYSIWVRVEGQWQELRGLDDENWTPDDAIHKIGEDNELIITVVVGRFTGFVNGKQVFQLSDGTLKGAKIGIYLATANTDEGEATVSIDSYAINRSVAAMTGN